MIRYPHNVSERTGQSMPQYRFILRPDWQERATRKEIEAYSGFYQEGENVEDALERLQARRPAPTGKRYLSADR